MIVCGLAGAEGLCISSVAAIQLAMTRRGTIVYMGSVGIYFDGGNVDNSHNKVAFLALNT